MLTNASGITLSQLRRTFGVQLNSDNNFFTNWLKNAPPLTQAEQVGIDRLCRNYIYLSQEEPPLEEIVKLDRSSGLPEYMRSTTYRLLENSEERSQVLQGLKQIGAYLTT